MNIRPIIKKLALAQGALLAIVASASTADARSHAAILGNPLVGSESSCFNFITAFGSIRQVCTGRRTWVIAPIYDNSGTMSARVSVFATSDGAVVCQARTVDHLGLNLISGSIASSTRAGLQDLVSVTPAHGFGGVQVNCDMDPNTELINVQY